ncbi:MAG: hypothetical protein QOG26_987 [Solirubrobacterales bacterium]|jgi:hypothetical protein|nr:hypothetical protein [Solirubrobacterales bacterium]
MADPAPGERGQASAELLAGLPALLLCGLLALQLLAVGYSLTLADGAAESAALAAAAGRPVAAAARASLPGWARSRIAVAARGGRVEVTLRPPSPLASIARRLAVRSSAWVRRPE